MTGEQCQDCGWYRLFLITGTCLAPDTTNPHPTFYSPACHLFNTKEEVQVGEPLWYKNPMGWMKELHLIVFEIGHELKEDHDDLPGVIKFLYPQTYPGSPFSRGLAQLIIDEEIYPAAGFVIARTCRDNPTLKRRCYMGDLAVPSPVEFYVHLSRVRGRRDDLDAAKMVEFLMAGRAVFLGKDGPLYEGPARNEAVEEMIHRAIAKQL